MFAGRAGAAIPLNLARLFTKQLCPLFVFVFYGTGSPFGRLLGSFLSLSRCRLAACLSSPEGEHSALSPPLRALAPLLFRPDARRFCRSTRAAVCLFVHVNKFLSAKCMRRRAVLPRVRAAPEQVGYAELVERGGPPSDSVVCSPRVVC